MFHSAGHNDLQFYFTYIKVLPKDWFELLSSLSSPQELKDILAKSYSPESENHLSPSNGSRLPQTFIAFIQRRQELIGKLNHLGYPWYITPSTLDLKSHLKIIDLEQNIACEKSINVVDKMCRKMSPKKLHEVINFSSFIHKKFDLMLKNTSNYLIDIGSGLGYLDQLLCQIYNYKTIAIESSSSHGEGAKKRNVFLEADDDW